MSVYVDVHKRLSRTHEIRLLINQSINQATGSLLAPTVRPAVHSMASCAHARRRFFTCGRAVVYFFEHLGRNKVEKRAELVTTVRRKEGENANNRGWLATVRDTLAVRAGRS